MTDTSHSELDIARTMKHHQCTREYAIDILDTLEKGYIEQHPDIINKDDIYLCRMSATGSTEDNEANVYWRPSTQRIVVASNDRGVYQTIDLLNTVQIRK